MASIGPLSAPLGATPQSLWSIHSRTRPSPSYTPVMRYDCLSTKPTAEHSAEWMLPSTRTILNELDTRLEVPNFGVGAYGLDQSFLRYQQDAVDFSPHIVVIGFMSENAPLLTYLEANQMQYIDVLDWLFAADPRAVQFLPGGHYAPRTHRVVARCIHGALERGGLLDDF